jgi:deoxyribose-phosphate aldolase
VGLIAATVDGRLEVKASGDIRDANQALAMVAAGATRLGMASSARY